MRGVPNSVRRRGQRVLLTKVGDGRAGDLHCLKTSPQVHPADARAGVLHCLYVGDIAPTPDLSMISMPMWTKTPRIVVACLAALLLAGFAGASAFPKPKPTPPGQAKDVLATYFGRNMARAEAIVVLQGVVHDFRIDRGRILSVAPGQIVLRELDGTIQQIPVAPDARVTVEGQSASPASLSRGLYATTVRDGNNPATIVQATFLR